MMSARGRWVAAIDDDAGGAAAGDEVADEGLELVLLVGGADGDGEVGEFVDDAEDDGRARRPGRSCGGRRRRGAGSGRPSRPAVRAGGRGRRGCCCRRTLSATGRHSPSSTILPSNSTASRRVQSAAWAMIVFSSDGLAGAGFAAGEQVAVHQGDRRPGCRSRRSRTGSGRRSIVAWWSAGGGVGAGSSGSPWFSVIGGRGALLAWRAAKADTDRARSRKPGRNQGVPRPSSRRDQPAVRTRQT